MVARQRLKPQDSVALPDEREYEAPSADRPPQRSTRSDTREAAHEPNHDKPRARVRRRKSTESEDMFYIPIEEIPEGSSYEWKRFSVKGEEDPFYIAGLREQGWEPVDPKKHPNWLPPGYNQPHIIKGGQILMERPIELTNEARSEERQLARRQIREAEARLGMTAKGEGTRDLPEVRPRVVKEIGRMVPNAAIED